MGEEAKLKRKMFGTGFKSVPKHTIVYDKFTSRLFLVSPVLTIVF